MQSPTALVIGDEPQAGGVLGIPDRKQMPGSSVGEPAGRFVCRRERFNQAQGIDVAFIETTDRHAAPPQVRQHMQERPPQERRVQARTSRAFRQGRGQQPAGMQQRERSGRQCAGRVDLPRLVE